MRTRQSRLKTLRENFMQTSLQLPYLSCPLSSYHVNCPNYRANCSFSNLYPKKLMEETVMLLLSTEGLGFQKNAPHVPRQTTISCISNIRGATNNFIIALLKLDSGSPTTKDGCIAVPESIRNGFTRSGAAHQCGRDRSHKSAESRREGVLAINIPPSLSPPRSLRAHTQIWHWR